MQDYRTIRDFRKVKLFDQIHEDPTYLSFFFMFDYYSDHSPLLNGAAAEYLRNVVGSETRAKHLEDFIKILKKVNAQYPWFWQGVTGLETAKEYAMNEPFWGEDKAIEIDCLETVELTVSAMMDLYRRAAFDFDRWVEVIPTNLRRFSLHIYVSEVRTFSSSDLKRASTVFNAITPGNTDLDIVGKQGGVKAERPHFAIKLGHCQFDINSGNSIFADLSRSPEGAAAPKIKIKWETTSSEGEYANSMLTDQNRTIGQMIGDVAKEKAGAIVDSAIDRTVENLKGRLLMGNVHGINALSTVQDAISAGSINGIANLVGGAVTGNRPTTVPKGDLGLAYDPVPKDSEAPIKENIHDVRPTDSEGPLGQNVYDPSPKDSEGPINENVHQ
jgi:hypothetical protein